MRTAAAPPYAQQVHAQRDAQKECELRACMMRVLTLMRRGAQRARAAPRATIRSFFFSLFRYFDVR